jgi:phasin family protein
MVQFSQMPPGLAGHPALQSQLEAQVGFFSALSLRAVDTMQRVNELNMQLARQLAEVSFATCREVLSCQDPTQAAAVAMHGLQPSGERLRDYQHSLFGVMAEAQASLPSAVAPRAGQPSASRRG